LSLKGFVVMAKQKSAVLELYRMARKKNPGEGPGTPVRVDADLVAKARYLAAGEGLELSAYVSGLLRPIIDREFKKAGRELLNEEEK
jgi:hypothetical protein